MFQTVGAAIEKRLATVLVFDAGTIWAILCLTNAMCGPTRVAAAQHSGSQVDRADATWTKCGHFEGDPASNRQPVKSMTLQTTRAKRFARAAICW